jgi:hypothetical protein
MLFIFSTPVLIKYLWQYCKATLQMRTMFVEMRLFNDNAHGQATIFYTEKGQVKINAGMRV